MKLSRLFKSAILCASLVSSFQSLASSGVYAGGPVYNNNQSSINELKSSQFSNLIVWTIHIAENGDLNYNAEFPLVSDGKYIGDQKYPDFKKDMANLKSYPSTITRLEIGLSGYGSKTFDNVKSLINCRARFCGTGPDSILYKNFKALKEAFPTVDALNNDDEDTYDLASSVKFHIMLADLGFKSAIVPYMKKTFWHELVKQVNSARPKAIDILYLQVYAGGAKNKPCEWDLGLPVHVGLWSKDYQPKPLQDKMQTWQSQCPNVVKGGFMWLYDDFDNSPRVNGYAQAINNVFGENQ